MKATAMRHRTAALMLVGAMVGSTTALPAAPRGQTRGNGAPEAPAPAPAPTHAVRGVVKSCDSKSLVVTRSSKKPSDLTFVLTPATLRTGTIAAGSKVSVRYRADGKTLVATAVIADRDP
jgi:hypothetical protein